MNLRLTLTRKFKGARRLAVLGVGSDLRGDDVAGLLAADAVQEFLKRRRPAGVRVAVFHGCTVPENLSGEIRRFRPTHLVILDAADVGRRPGTVELLDPDSPTLNPSASTHGLPIPILASFFRNSIGCEVVLVGIQPGGRAFESPPSKAVSAAASRVGKAILAALGAGTRKKRVKTR